MAVKVGALGDGDANQTVTGTTATSIMRTILGTMRLVMEVGVKLTGKGAVAVAVAAMCTEITALTSPTKLVKEARIL